MVSYIMVKIMDIKLNDILVMKKEHPCGGKDFLVLRVGMDFRVRCVKCNREVMVPRQKIEKNIKKVMRDGVQVDV
jgi:hypothetical protein